MPERVLVGFDAKSKRQVLQTLAEELAGSLGVEQDEILRALLEREKLGTTGIGDGLAIPHAKLDGIDEVTGFFMRLSSPVDFDALDDQPVDMVFCLLAPCESGAEHLKALARVARVFRDEDLCAKLRHATSNSSAYALLVPSPASNAA
ncbi:MAG: PTS sugar transporter subunit IIA [Geminicoccaceae bacterium]|nr:PTS sugar transporter subunit IIA [Geminicoccaceae bacterium]